MTQDNSDASIYGQFKGEYAIFREIVEGLGDMVFVKDLTGNYLSVNQSFADHVRLSKEAIIGRHDREVVGNRLTAQIARHERKLLEAGTSIEYDLQFDQPGQLTLFRCRKYLLRDKKGNPTAIVGISRDVTGQRLAESKYRFIFDNAPIAFWEEDFTGVKTILDELRSKGVQDFRKYFRTHPLDLERCIGAIRIIDVNLATLRMNRTMDKPRFIHELKRTFTEDSKTVFIDEFAALAEGRTLYQSEASTIEVGDDKLEVLFNLNVLPGHEKDLSLVLVSVVDITHIKQTENQLKQMKELYRSVVEGQHEMICRFRHNGELTFFNSAFQQFFGSKLNSNRNFKGMLPEFEDSFDSFCQQISPTEPTCSLMLHNYDHSGRMVWQQWSISGFFDRNGRVTEYQAVGTDITERRDTEERLAASEARWRSVFDNAEDLILTMNANGLILSANRPATEAYGAKLAGKLLNDVLLDKENAERTGQALGQVFEAASRVEMEMKLVNGKLKGRVLSCVFTPIYHGDRVLSATLIARDVTESRKLENQMREALIEGQEQERKRVSRELHDGLGQLFTAIKLNMHHLKSGLGPDSSADALKRLELLEHNIGVAINEVKQISHNLMPDVLEQFGLAPALHDLVNSWNQSGGQMKVTLGTVDLDSEPPAHMALALFRMAQELITNAVRHSSATYVFVQIIDHGPSILLMVEDDGKGFDPSEENGGLGLRNIRSRAELLDGTVEIDSSPGNGTVTTIEIPRTAAIL